jgi:hypothetical protein
VIYFTFTGEEKKKEKKENIYFLLPLWIITEPNETRGVSTRSH